ncbi:hypothetical protein KJ693_05945 [bacterium]|nr:hypothetical protein [bacterium]MBU1614841.1 hypothetical protein [bacterium]
MELGKYERQILSEVKGIPLHELPKIIEFLHYIKTGMMVEKPVEKKNVKRFAGMWKDMSEEEFGELTSLYKDRNQYFKERVF